MNNKVSLSKPWYRVRIYSYLVKLCDNDLSFFFLDLTFIIKIKLFQLFKIQYYLFLNFLTPDLMTIKGEYF